MAMSTAGIIAGSTVDLLDCARDTRYPYQWIAEKGVTALATIPSVFVPFLTLPRRNLSPA